MLWLLLFLQNKSYLLMILENNPMCYADDSILLIEVPKPFDGVPAVASLNHDLAHNGV